MSPKNFPPAFNLRNEVMLAKHVHATFISYLFQLGRNDNEDTGTGRSPVTEVLRQMLPNRITSYLFDPTGQIRQVPFDTFFKKPPILSYTISCF